LKKIAQSDYGGVCEIFDPKIPIPVMANAFYLLKNVRNVCGVNTDPNLGCNRFLTRG